MTEQEERKVRDVMRRLDPKLDELISVILFRMRFIPKDAPSMHPRYLRELSMHPRYLRELGEMVAPEEVRKLRALEDMVGPDEAKKFVQDAREDFLAEMAAAWERVPGILRVESRDPRNSGGCCTPTQVLTRDPGAS